MKIILGILAGLLIASLLVLSILSVWSVQIVSWAVVGRVVLSVSIALAGVLFLWLIGILFFKREKYRSEGRQAHRMK